MRSMPAALSPIHILLIDDHALLRAGLRMVVQAGVPGALLREAGSIAEAAREAGGNNGAESAIAPALVLLDIEMPGLNGLDGLTVLKKKWPDAPVVMLSSHTEPETVRSALARGAAAYVSKAEPSERIIAVIDRVLRAQRKDARGPGVDGVASAAADAVADAAARGVPDDGGLSRLTARQCEVLELISEGLSNKVIGRRLDLSENTVRGHVQAVLAHLGVSSRTEAAFAARRRGLIR